MNRALAPIPAFAQTEPPSQGDLGALLARAQRLGIPPERVLLALGYPLPDDDATSPREAASSAGSPRASD